jgi:hypothetical protein
MDSRYISVGSWCMEWSQTLVNFYQLIDQLSWIVDYCVPRVCYLRSYYTTTVNSELTMLLCFGLAYIPKRMVVCLVIINLILRNLVFYKRSSRTSESSLYVSRQFETCSISRIWCNDGKALSSFCCYIFNLEHSFFISIYHENSKMAFWRYHEFWRSKLVFARYLLERPTLLAELRGNACVLKSLISSSDPLLLCGPTQIQEFYTEITQFKSCLQTFSPSRYFCHVCITLDGW